jgi:hypothetical protein
MNRSTFVLALSLVAGVSFAGPRGPLVSVPVKSIQEVFATHVASVGGDGTIGAFHSIPRFNQSRNVPNMVMAWDSMSTSATTLGAYTNGVYGAHPGPVRLFSDNYRNFQFLNDVTLSPAGVRRFGRYVRVAAFVNPNGTGVAGGSAPIAVRVTATSDFDSDGAGPAIRGPLSSIVATFPTQTSGSKYFTIDLRSDLTETALSLPNGSGGLMVEFGTVSAGQFEPLAFPFAIQPLLSNMLSPGESLFPGTNPSLSSNWQWDDDGDIAFGIGNPDYVFQDFTNTDTGGGQFAELYDYDDSVRGVLQGAVAVFADTNVRTISGTISFGDLPVGAPKPKSARVIVALASTNAVLADQVVALGANGEYTAMDPNQSAGGVYKVLVKSSHWLQKQTTATTTAGSVTGRNVSLMNGDINGDNSVDLLDYFRLSDAYNLDSTAPGWAYPAIDGSQLREADLNEDGSVDLLDYFILSDRYNQVGDEL